MVGIKTGSREEAIHALMNMWLKDTRKSCVYCGRMSNFDDCIDCEGINPPLGTNKEILVGFTQELERVRLTRGNKWASNKQKNIRYAVSMPAGLYTFLDKMFQRLYKEKLFNDEYNTQWFMRKFGKYFSVPEER